MSKFDFFASDIKDADAFMKDQLCYKDLKRSELEDIPESEIVSAVTAWIEGKFADDWSDMCEKINALPTPCLNVYCADYIAKEVLNGGFAQVFFNASYDFVSAAAEGFRALGGGKTASVIDTALEIYSGGAKPSGRSLEDFLEFSSSGAYDEADKAFISVFDDKRFCRLVRSYVLAYKKYFGD